MQNPIKNLIILIYLILILILGLVSIKQVRTESSKGSCVCSRTTGACIGAVVVDGVLYCNGKVI